MYFYVDESGNSGNNLFDPNQPILSYGVLSSEIDVDDRATDKFAAMLGKISRPALHANQLKFEGLRPIGGDLLSLYERLSLGFDFYFIEKRAYALVSFFNAVFDEGVNDAVPWTWYWTPLRFALIGLLHNLLDDSILREAWELCLIAKNDIDDEKDRIVELLRQCLARLESSQMQAEPREIIRDGFLFGLRYPQRLDFGVYSQKAFSPNAVGFQFVLSGIAARSRLTGRVASKILVDRQSQFNAAQLDAYSMQSRKAEWFRENPEDRKQYAAHPFFVGAREELETLISHFPQERATVSDSKSSIGLQIADTLLWITNRAIREDVIVPPELRKLTFLLLTTGRKDGISLPLMMRRWQAFEKNLPAFNSLTDEQKAISSGLKEEHRNKVRGMKLE